MDAPFEISLSKECALRRAAQCCRSPRAGPLQVANDHEAAGFR
jgi:hypothetical protein